MTGYHVIRLVKSVRAHRSVAVKTYWVYMLLCVDGGFYVGMTNNLELRLGQHTVGIDRRCYTFTRRPLVLVHSSDFHHIDEAIAWEKQLKGWSRAKKAALIENDWPLISPASQKLFWAALSPFDRLRVTKPIDRRIGVALRQAQGDKGRSRVTRDWLTEGDRSRRR